MGKSICLKIGRHEYIITEKDKFMDNGCSVQLLTQSKERSDWGRRPSPILSQKAIKYISQYKRIEYKHDYPKTVSIFCLKF